MKWKKRKLGLGALMLADGRLIIQAEDGQLVIAQAVPESYQELARTPAVANRSWVCPVLANGKILCRSNSGDVVCFDVPGM